MELLLATTLLQDLPLSANWSFHCFENLATSSHSCYLDGRRGTEDGGMGGRSEAEKGDAGTESGGRYLNRILRPTGDGHDAKSF